MNKHENHQPNPDKGKAAQLNSNHQPSPLAKLADPRDIQLHSSRNLHSSSSKSSKSSSSSSAPPLGDRDRNRDPSPNPTKGSWLARVSHRASIINRTQQQREFHHTHTPQHSQNLLSSAASHSSPDDSHSLRDIDPHSQSTLNPDPHPQSTLNPDPHQSHPHSDPHHMAYTAIYHEDSDQDLHTYASSETSHDDDMNSPDHTPTTFAHVHSQPHSNSHSHSQSQPHSHSLHASPVGHLTEWTAPQCADWITALGLGQYATLFIRESVTGEALIEIQNEDLKDIGINSTGHRLSVLKAVYEIKVEQNIPLDPDHYIPLSAEGNAYDMTATQDDIARVIESIRQRDQRILAAETDLRVMRENFERMLEENRKLREDTLPIIRMVKDRSHPLPTPEPPAADTLPEKKPSGLSRKFSTKKLFLGSAPKNLSPTIHESSNLDPSAAAMAASSHLLSASQNSPTYLLPQMSPTSPQYAQQAFTVGSRSFSRDGGPSPDSRQQTPDDQYAYNGVVQSATSVPQGTSRGARREPPHTSSQQLEEPPLSATLPPSSSPMAPRRRREERESNGRDESSSGILKSFRVSVDDPCWKVLPVAMERYGITEDWRQYSLYIVYGDQERCLGTEEKPLLLYKQFAREGRNPMFMLRKHPSPSGFEGFSQGLDAKHFDAKGTVMWGFDGKGQAIAGPSTQTFMRGDDGRNLPGGVL